MTPQEFKNLTKEEQMLEIERCKNSFEYFYNNYCRKEGMREFSQEVFDQYIESNKKERFSRRRVRNSFYPLTIEELYTKTKS